MSLSTNPPSNSRLPPSRIAAGILDRDHFDSVREDAVIDRLGEPPRQRTTYVLVDDLMDLRSLLQTGEDDIEGRHEVVSQAGALLLIPVICFVHLIVDVGMK
jgi:hypothetical protein